MDRVRRRRRPLPSRTAARGQKGFSVAPTRGEVGSRVAQWSRKPGRGEPTVRSLSVLKVARSFNDRKAPFWLPLAPPGSSSPTPLNTLHPTLTSALLSFGLTNKISTVAPFCSPALATAHNCSLFAGLHIHYPPAAYEVVTPRIPADL